MRKEIDSMIIGGTKAGPSLPGPRLQRLLGKRIQINVVDHTLQVPTPEGIVIARQGDRIILYDDDTLEVEKNENA